MRLKKAGVVIFVLMKIFKNILLLCLLGASAFVITSCKEDKPDEEPIPTAEDCILSNISEVNDSTSEDSKFEYSVLGKLTRYQSLATAVTFNYENDRLINVLFDGGSATFEYGSNGKPSRLSISPEEYNLFTYEGENLSEIEYHFSSKDSFVYKTRFFYVESNISLVTDGRYNKYTQETTLDTSVYRISTDDKKSIFQKDFATMFWVFIEHGDLNVLCGNNITSYTAVSPFHEDLEVSISYEYNEHGYPTKSTKTGFSSDNILLYTYECN
jgi:hypothetical protein